MLMLFSVVLFYCVVSFFAAGKLYNALCRRDYTSSDRIMSTTCAFLGPVMFPVLLILFIFVNGPAGGILSKLNRMW